MEQDNAPEKNQSEEIQTNPITEALEPIEEGWDPKNRSVQMFQKGENFFVTKERTGFKSEEVSKEEAEKIFDFQIGCSQNQ
jgi:hypothetical protein